MPGDKREDQELERDEVDELGGDSESEGDGDPIDAWEEGEIDCHLHASRPPCIMDRCPIFDRENRRCLDTIEREARAGVVVQLESLLEVITPAIRSKLGITEDLSF